MAAYTNDRQEGSLENSGALIRCDECDATMDFAFTDLMGTFQFADYDDDDARFGMFLDVAMSQFELTHNHCNHFPKCQAGSAFSNVCNL